MSEDEPAGEEDRAATDSSSLQDMTDDTTDDGMEQVASTDEAAGADPEPTPENPEDADPAGEPGNGAVDVDLRRKLNYALLAGLSLLALIAALQFYLNASAVIDQWVTREFRSLFKAVFNLAVLLVAAAGISRQVRRLKA